MTAFLTIGVVLALAAAAFVAVPLWRARGRAVAAVLAVVLPLSALGIYAWTSDWSWDEPTASSPPAHPANLEQVIAVLEQRLRQQPDDVTGWKLLGRSWAVTGNYTGAREAFEQAYTRSAGRDVEAMVGYAEALVLNDEQALDGRAGQLFEEALRLAPNDARALWYGGITAWRRNDPQVARERWLALQAQELPPEIRQAVAERLEALGQGPATEPAVAGGAIEVQVDVAPALAAMVPAEGALFLIARRGDSGPPLAVARYALAEWPRALRLTDADAMLPGTSLRAQGSLRLVARISRSGVAAAASGDLWGEVGYDPAAVAPASLTIDRSVP